MAEKLLTRGEILGLDLLPAGTSIGARGNTTAAEADEYRRLSAQAPSLPSLPDVTTAALSESVKAANDAVNEWSMQLDDVHAAGLLGPLTTELERRVRRGDQAVTYDTLTRERIDGLDRVAQLRETATAAVTALRATLATETPALLTLARERVTTAEDGYVSTYGAYTQATRRYRRALGSWETLHRLSTGQRQASQANPLRLDRLVKQGVEPFEKPALITQRVNDALAQLDPPPDEDARPVTVAQVEDASAATDQRGT